MISTGIYIDIGIPVKLTLFKFLCPIIFLVGAIKLNYRRIEKFNFILLLYICFLLLFSILRSNEYISLANIALMALGMFGTYLIYTNIDFKRRKQILFILLLVLFIQSSIELLFLALKMEAELFLFPTVGRVDGWVTEPSHYAYIVLLLCITYITSFNISLTKGLLLLLFFLPSLYFSQSSYGYIFLLLSLIIAMTYHTNKMKSYETLFYSLCGGLFIITLMALTYQNELTQRVFDTLAGFYNYDDQAMDSSARVRLFPFMILMQMIDTFSINNLIFGNGLGSSGYFISNVVGVNTEEGHLTSFLYDFGLVGLLWIFALIKFITSEMPSKLWIRLMFIFMMFNMNIGTQVFWLSIFCFAVIRFEQSYYHKFSRSREIS